jgi:hypothetical protein
MIQHHKHEQVINTWKTAVTKFKIILFYKLQNIVYLEVKMCSLVEMYWFCKETSIIFRVEK